MFRNPAFGIKLRPASAWMKLSSCFYCHHFRIFTGRALFGDVLTLPVRLRPPEMGIVLVIGAFCRYWEGAFVSGG